METPRQIHLLLPCGTRIMTRAPACCLRGAAELLAMRGAFLSKLIYKTFNGYVLSQFKKLEQDLRAKGEIKQKHAMHLTCCRRKKFSGWK